ncbi:MAG: radical SAM protein, partial [Acidobacteria bacterium]|nr:radical SAM protein [Acidobacteriota bacterium]
MDEAPTEKGSASVASGSSEFRPSLVSWNLTKRCNLRCPHCYLSAGKKAEAELTTEECLGLIDEMKALGTEMVILTGGEPLLRKDIFDIATRSAEHGFWVVMGTNGVLVDDRVAQRMVDCGVKGVGISIDSVDPAKHNSFRGGPNSWEHSVRALEVCRRHGLEVLVQSTVMAENYDEVPRLIDFAREIGA